MGRNDRPLSRKLLKQLIHALNVPVREVGVVSEFACRPLVPAFTEHYPEMIAREEAPSIGVDRFLLESKNVHVIARRYRQIADSQYTPGIDDLSHAQLVYIRNELVSSTLSFPEDPGGSMTTSTIAHPPIVSREQWLAERKKLLADEKELTKHYDRINAERRRLPMVKIEKEYVFEGPTGKPSLKDLFEGRRQLIVYHFMFDPSWEKGCSGCTGFVDALGNLSLLNKRDTTFVVISRAPLAKLEAYKAEKQWSIAWYSSFGSDFNYDFHVTLDPKVAPAEYNYRTKEEMAAAMHKPVLMEGEEHGLSVFFRLDDDVFHTYSVYARGTESLTDAYRLLDTTPYGRQQDFEDSPPGWPQQPTYPKAETKS